jgi:hypothetical protein
MRTPNTLRATLRRHISMEIVMETSRIITNAGADTWRELCELQFNCFQARMVVRLMKL